MEKELIDKSVTGRILNRIGAFVRDEAKRRCPVDTGALRSSIQYKIDGDSVFIFSDNENAVAMEYGEPPKLLDEDEQESLTKWSERHGANPRGMIKYIQKEGIRVGTPKQPMHITGFGRNSYRPFMRPALYQNISKIKDIIREEVQVSQR